MSRITYLSAFALVLAAAPLSAPSVLAQDAKLPSALTLTAYDTGSSGFNIAVAVGKSLKDKNGLRRARAAGRQRRRAAGAPAGQSRAGLRHGHRHLFRAGGRVRVRGQGVGTAADQAHDVGHRLQRHLARRRQGHRRQGGQGPARQARRHGGRLAGAQPERLRRAGLRRPDAQRREARRVLELRRHVEGHGQQRGRRGDRLQHLGPGQGGRDLAARHRIPAHARRPTRKRWARLHKIGPYYQPHKSTCGAGVPAGGSVELPVLPLPDLHGLRLAAGRSRLQSHQGDDRQLRCLQGCGAGRSRPRPQAAELHVGAALPRGSGEGPEGGGRLEGRARGAQPEAPEAPGHAGRRVGRVPEEQPARRQGRLRQGLVGGAQGGAAGAGMDPVFE